MKSPNHSHPKGVTLIELTVVIAMILSLSSGLFFSASYYKESSDRAACLVQLESMQKAVRSYQNFNNLKTGDPLPVTAIVGVDKAIPSALLCPFSSGDYVLLEEVPASGAPYAKCQDYDRNSGIIDKNQDHTPADTSAW